MQQWLLTDSTTCTSPNLGGTAAFAGGTAPAAGAPGSFTQTPHFRTGAPGMPMPAAAAAAATAASPAAAAAGLLGPAALLVPAAAAAAPPPASSEPGIASMRLLIDAGSADARMLLLGAWLGSECTRPTNMCPGSCPMLSSCTVHLWRPPVNVVEP